MKHFLFFLLFSTLVVSSMAQSKTDCESAVNKFRDFYNHQQTDSIYAMFSDKIKSTMPSAQVAAMMGTLQKQFGDMGTYEFVKQKKEINFYKTNFKTGTLTLLAALNSEKKFETFRFLPYNPDTAKAVKEESNFILKTTKGNIYGTLTLPKGDKPVPVVLIIAGSGPTDRDGNNNSGLQTNAYKMIADSLQQAGIAAVRYDKRGVGESTKGFENEESLTFDEMVSDATGFAKMLKNDKRFSKVIILGHSEGSLIGMIAANKEKVNGFISVAGIAERADKIIVKQLGAQSKDLAAAASTALDSLRQGYSVKSINPALDALFRPSVQPYMRSWLKYDPATEIKKLTQKVLIIQGTNDLQVGIDEADALKKASPHATLKMVIRMNHVLKQAPAGTKGNIATYSMPNLPLCPGFMTDVLAFINEKPAK